MTRDVIDLTKLTGSDPNYICEACDRRLLPHTDPNRITAGELFICPECGQVKDTDLDQIKRADPLRPSGQNEAFIGMLTLGQKDTPKRVKISDPEPQFEEMLESQGANIIGTYVDVG